MSIPYVSGEVSGRQYLAHKAHLAATTLHEKHDITVQVINARFLKPLDEAMIEDIAKRFKFIITLEEGTLSGGFGSAVAEFLFDHKIENVDLIRFGIPDRFMGQGNRNRMLSEVGLTTEAIIDAVRQIRADRDSNKGSRIRNLFRFTKNLKSA